MCSPVSVSKCVFSSESGAPGLHNTHHIVAPQLPHSCPQHPDYTVAKISFENPFQSSLKGSSVRRLDRGPISRDCISLKAGQR